MKNTFFTTIIACFSCFTAFGIKSDAECGKKTSENLLPSQRQIEWANCEIGVIIHHDLQVYSTNTDSAAVFNPPQLDTDQWLAAAASVGAKYAVLVAKHCTGFSLWPTKAHDFSVASSPWKNGKGDIVADFIASCRKYGIRPGIYASTGCNYHFKICDDFVKQPEAVWRPYVEMVKQQLTELWTNYGELFEIWFDGGNLPEDCGGREIEDLLVKLQPNAVVFQGNPERMPCVRWIGNERATAPNPCWCRTVGGTGSDGVLEQSGILYTGDPDGAYWCPGEADMPTRNPSKKAFQGGWFWRAGEDGTVFTPEEMMDRYFKSVGRSCNLLLGMAIDNRGLLPDAECRAFARFGKMVRDLYAHPVAQTNGCARAFELACAAVVKPTVACLEEDISRGENVLSFVLSGFDGQSWHSLFEGKSIGHKRLIRLPSSGTFTHFRLEIRGVRKGAEPAIKGFTLYAANGL